MIEDGDDRDRRPRRAASEPGSGRRYPRKRTPVPELEPEEAAAPGLELDPAVAAIARRVRVLKWVVVVVLVPIGGALIAIAAKIYSSGYDAGVAAGWQRSVDYRLERLERAAERRP